MGKKKKKKQVHDSCIGLSRLEIVVLAHLLVATFHSEGCGGDFEAEIPEEWKARMEGVLVFLGYLYDLSETGGSGSNLSEAMNTGWQILHGFDRSLEQYRIDKTIIALEKYLAKEAK